MPRTAAKISQADVARVLRAMKKTGVEGVVRIAPDGTVVIVPPRMYRPQDEKPEEDFKL